MPQDSDLASGLALDLLAQAAPDSVSATRLPQVSICLTVHDQRDYARQAIASILKQTFADFELIICDTADAACESIGEAGLADYLSGLADDRIHYLNHDWANRSGQLRSGFAAAQGTYFVQLDEKHRLTPDYLARTVAVFQAQECLGLSLDRCLDQGKPGQAPLDFVSTGHWLIDAAGRRDLAQTEDNAERWGRTRLQDGPIADLIEETFVYQSLQVEATLFRRSALEAVDYLRLGLEHCEDSDLMVRLALSGKRAHFLSARLMEYRMPKPSLDLSRKLQYLRDKVAYFDFFQFTSPSFEQLRQQRLAESQLRLGLRLIEVGDLELGRQHLWQGQAASRLKAIAGLALSYAPATLRSQTFGWLRRSRAAKQAWAEGLV